MKLHFKIYAVTFMAIGGMLMANHSGNCSGPSYKEYSSQDADLNIEMDYLSGWDFREHRGSYGSYAQVQFYGEVKQGFAPSFIVTVEPSSKVSFKPLTLKAMADDLIAKRMHFKDARVESRSEIELLGLPAVDMTVTYAQPDQMRSVNPESVPFKERIIILKMDDRFFTLRYINPDQVFEDYEEEFLHCVETLSIKT